MVELRPLVSGSVLASSRQCHHPLTPANHYRLVLIAMRLVEGEESNVDTWRKGDEGGTKDDDYDGR